MITTSPRVLLTVVTLCTASLLLTGCPKTVPPGAGAGSGTGSSAAPVATGSGGFGAAGTTAGGATGSGATTDNAAAPTGSGGSSGVTLPALPSPREFVEVEALQDVHFDFDRYTIRSQDRAALDANARWLKSNAGALLLIEGHADERGTNEYNLALGERRAKATRDQLAERGIPTSRVTILTYGEERPLCTERTEGCWAKNRRAHFLVKQ